MTSHSMENLSFHSLLRWRWLYYQFSLHHSYNRFVKGWENTLFELRSERVNRSLAKSSWRSTPALGENPAYSNRKAHNTYLAVELDVDCLPLGIDHLEGVAAVAVHVPEAIRDATVTEQEADLVGCLWAQADEVPEHVRILQNVKRRGQVNYENKQRLSQKWKRVRKNPNHWIKIENKWINKPLSWSLDWLINQLIICITISLNLIGSLVNNITPRLTINWKLINHGVILVYSILESQSAQNLLCQVLTLRWVTGFLFWVWIKLGN